MGKLKLQMHISLNGFVAALNNEPANFHWDDELRGYAIANLRQVDTILLGSKTAPDFITHWASVAANPADADHQMARLLTDIPKIVCSKKITTAKWPNAKMANGDLADEIGKLKNEKGHDIMVYGGAGFVSSLITAELIDEYHLLAEPVALGGGMPIFKQHTNLKLIKATPFNCGVVVLQYEPSKKTSK